MIEVDLLVKNARQLINPASDDRARGTAMNSLRVSDNAWLAAAGETISFIGTKEDFQRHCRLRPGGQVIDAGDFIALPGFVDPHSHLPFAGARQEEFRQKLQGVSYQEIAAAGGGIKSTVRATRGISAAELLSLCEQRLDLIMLAGTTTLESKSGYGLDHDTEIKQLEVIQALDSIHPVDLVPTFMGAHEIPEEFSAEPRHFLDYLLAEVLPEIKSRQLADFVDIFCEDGYFSLADADYYLEKSADAGFALKVHADEFSSNGAAAMAVNRKAVSAEHLIAISDRELEILCPSDTAAILLPGVSFFLRLGKYAPARRFIDGGAIVALGTDFNPGSSMVSSQLFIFHLGIFQLAMTIEEALNAVTINAAYAVGRQKQVGSLAPGKKMDLLLLDIPDYTYLGYHLGINPVHTVVKAGEVVVRNRRPVYRMENGSDE